MKNEPEDRRSVYDDEVDGVPEPEFKRLSAEEAAEWRSRQPPRVGLASGALAAAAGIAVGAVGVVVDPPGGGGRIGCLWCLCILLPTALMAYGLTSSGLARVIRRLFPGMSGLSLAGLFFWEGVKVLLASP